MVGGLRGCHMQCLQGHSRDTWDVGCGFSLLSIAVLTPRLPNNASLGDRQWHTAGSHNLSQGPLPRLLRINQQLQPKLEGGANSGKIFYIKGKFRLRWRTAPVKNFGEWNNLSMVDVYITVKIFFWRTSSMNETTLQHTQQHYKICSLAANMCYGLSPRPMGQPWSSFGGLHLTQ